MRFYLQRIRHDPENGYYGDCHRTALACILDVEPEQVPNFMENLGPKDGEVFKQREKEFLAQVGLTVATVPFSGELEDILNCLGVHAPNAFYLLGGTSGSSCGHTVVGLGGKIVHDPDPKQVGITGPMDDGYYWVTFLTPKF